MTRTESATNSHLPVSEHGTIDITDGVPSGLVHIDLPRLGLTCKRLDIDYRKGIVGWTEVGKRRNKKCYPVFSGVVVLDGDQATLMQAVAEKGKKRQKNVDRLPVLAALFTLNRRAKRCRDLAQTYYQRRMHGVAAEMKREKNRIYDIKGQVLLHMVEAGVLVGGKFHRFEFGNWAEILAGGGYTFHRPCPPQEEANIEAAMIESIEAKPKSAKEPTLEVAYEVVGNYLQGKNRASVYQWTRVPRGRLNQWREQENELEEEIENLEDDEDYEGGQYRNG
jgi:hypothetical protein